jgi:hypothetical protein
METFVGLDVSLKETSVCILNQKGALVFEGQVESDSVSAAAYEIGLDEWVSSQPAKISPLSASICWALRAVAGSDDGHGGYVWRGWGGGNSTGPRP